MRLRQACVVAGEPALPLEGPYSSRGCVPASAPDRPGGRGLFPLWSQPAPSARLSLAERPLPLISLGDGSSTHSVLGACFCFICLFAVLPLAARQPEFVEPQRQTQCRAGALRARHQLQKSQSGTWSSSLDCLHLARIWRVFDLGAVKSKGVHFPSIPLSCSLVSVRLLLGAGLTSPSLGKRLEG